MKLKQSIVKPEPFQYSFHRVIDGRTRQGISAPGFTETLFRTGGYGLRLKGLWKGSIQVRIRRYRDYCDSGS